MLIKYLLNMVTKGNTDYRDKEVRGRIGYITGVVGLVINILLAVLKLIIGIGISSIAVMADAFNNLSDAISSVLTIVGFKISNLPPDKEHPYGHGRVEYLLALVIAFLVMLVGAQFVKSSIDRIMNPEALKFTWISFILLVISVVFKFGLYLLNKILGEKISSTALKATALDALVDVIITLVIILSLLLPFITDFPIDGYVGFVVSIIILYSGFSLVKETISPLIGEAPSEEIIRAINEEIMSYDYILGSHDLMVHKYGPGRKIAIIDVEVPAYVDLVTIHNIIDRAEREIGKKYNLHLVIHVDPVGHESEEVKEMRKKVKYKISRNKLIESIHDFNIVEEDGIKCLVFHIVVDGNKIGKGFCKKELKDQVIEGVREIDPQFNCDIVVDIEY